MHPSPIDIPAALSHGDAHPDTPVTSTPTSSVQPPPIISSEDTGFEVDDGTASNHTPLPEEEDASKPNGEFEINMAENRMSGLPSPPLTRVGTNESLRERQPNASLSVDQSGAEDGIEQPHSAAHVQTTTLPLEDGGDVVDSNGRLLYPYGSSPSPQLLDVKHSSPQPWDLVDPPENNGRRTHDIYSTIGSRKFHTLQSTASRPLKPKSSYYFGPPPSDSAYGTPPVGRIGLHQPREIIRVERDYSGGELIQFAPIYPLELEGRLTPTQFLESINSMNEILISAHSLRHSFLDNLFAVLSLQITRLIFSTHYDQEMQRLQRLIEDLNTQLYNPLGLNILWPRKVGFLYLEIEYY